MRVTPTGISVRSGIADPTSLVQGLPRVEAIGLIMVRYVTRNTSSLKLNCASMSVEIDASLHGVEVHIVHQIELDPQPSLVGNKRAPVPVTFCHTHPKAPEVCVRVVSVCALLGVCCVPRCGCWFQGCGCWFQGCQHKMRQRARTCTTERPSGSNTTQIPREDPRRRE